METTTKTRSYLVRQANGEFVRRTETYVPRWCVNYRKIDDDEYPGLPLTGTEREIREDYEFFLSRHPELTEENFIEVARREI